MYKLADTRYRILGSIGGIFVSGIGISIVLVLDVLTAMEHDVIHQAIPACGVVEAQRAAQALLRRGLRRAAGMTCLLVQIQLPPKQRDEANK